MLIDVHSHIVPEHLPPAEGRADAGRWPCLEHFDAGRARVMIEGRNFRTITAANWDVERRLADMAGHGAGAQVLSPMPELLSYWFEPAGALDLNRAVNETIAAMVGAAPQHFHGLGCVPLQDPALACEELTRVASLGLRGVEIGSNVNGVHLGDTRFVEFFHEAQRLGLCVFVHALHPTVAAGLASPALVNPIGFPTDTGLTIASFIGSGTAERVPDLRIAFSHGGGTFPAMLPRLEYFFRGTWNEDPAPAGRTPPIDLPRPPSEYARRFFYDSLVFDRRAIRYLLDLMGTSQVVIGTDYPYMAPEQPADHSVASLGLSADELDAVDHRNALRLLGLDPATT